MKKRNRKILTFIIAIAVMGYGLVGYNLVSSDTVEAHSNMKMQENSSSWEDVSTDTVEAHSSMKMQENSSDCEDEESDCGEEHTKDCSSCVTIHNSCHSNDFLVPNNEIYFLNTQYLLSSLENVKYSNLNYPPDTPPV